MTYSIRIVGLYLLSIAAASVVGCSPSSTGKQASHDSSTPGDEHDHDGDHHSQDSGASHEHAEGGPHGGRIVDWGGGKFHAEVQFDFDHATVTVFVLGSDEVTAAPVLATDGKILLTIYEGKFQIELLAKPQKGDTQGQASRFAGKDSRLGSLKKFSATISGELDGIPYAGDFEMEADKHSHHSHGTHSHGTQHAHDEK